CEPRKVLIEVLNPFVPSSGDSRELGVQLKYLRVTSRLLVPIVSSKLIIRAWLGIFLISLLAYGLFWGERFTWLPFAVPLASGLLISQMPDLRLTPVSALFAFSASLLVGAYLHKKRGSFKATTKANGSSDFSLLAGFVLAMAVIIGGILRFYNYDFGLPHLYHPDEFPKFKVVNRMIQSGSLNPQYFLHPSLLLYSTFMLSRIFDLFGFMHEHASLIILSGRTVSVLAGIASIYLVYAIGRRLYSAYSGILAAIILALCPLHVTCSRYLKEDSLLTFTVLVTALFSINFLKSGKKKFFILSALFAGVAMGSKYSGIFIIPFIYLPFILKAFGLNLKDSPRLSLSGGKAAILGAFAISAGFLCTTPYAILDSTAFLRDFLSEAHHMARGHTITITPWSQLWMYHFYYSIIPGLTPSAAIIAAAGLGILARRRKVEDLAVIVLFLLFYLPAEGVNAKPAPQPERYILPCIPVLALSAAEFVSFLREKQFMLFHSLALFLVIVMPLKRTVDLASEIKPDTRDTMKIWIERHIPRGSRIAMDWKPYNPPLNPDYFKIDYLPRDNILSNLLPEKLKSSGYDYLLLSSLFYERFFKQPGANPAFREVIRKVFESFPLVHEEKAAHGPYGFHNPTIKLLRIN
ncbi:MAG: phospholipid carrier-dependent glycosyltransferase, partial [Candidatus Dadabacteria bacterium]